MKFGVLFLSVAFLLGACSINPGRSRSPLAASSPAIREYQIADNQFVILVVQKNGLSDADAKSRGMEKAAEVTVEQGGRYFTIVKEEKVQVLQTPDGQDYHPDLATEARNPPPDLYQQLIQRSDQRGTGVISWDNKEAEPLDGLRITIQVYPENPGDGYDACKFTECGE